MLLFFDFEKIKSVLVCVLVCVSVIGARTYMYKNVTSTTSQGANEEKRRSKQEIKNVKINVQCMENRNEIRTESFSKYVHGK